MTSVRRRLGALVATLAVPIALLVAFPVAGFADGDPEVSIDGTICWEVETENIRHSGADNPGYRGQYLTLTLSVPSRHEVVVIISTKDGTAKAPYDYRPLRGLKVTIPPGTTTVRVPLDIVADGEPEPDEWFSARIDEARGATVRRGEALVIIRDGAPQQTK